MSCIKFYGAPGTGKTRALIGEFKNAMSKGIKPNNILCTQFRSEAATEVKPIIAAATGFAIQDLKSVRTIHGECLSLLHQNGMLKTDDKAEFLMKSADYTKFNKEYSYNVKFQRTSLAEIEVGSEDPLLAFYSWMKGTGTPLYSAGDYPGRGIIPVENLKAFYSSYEEFKQKYDKIDYGDMLNIVLEKGLVPDCPVQMYDEAQDMTPVMYKLAKLWSKDAEHMFFAGDPLQTLYPFWGANPVFFLETEGEMQILPESHRLPKNVWELASELIALRTPYQAPSIKTKEMNGIIKKIESRNLSGFLEHEFYPKLKPASTVFHLTRTNRLGKAVAETLAQIGVPYSGICGWKPDEIKFFNAIAKKRRGEELTPADYAALIKLSPSDKIYSALPKDELISQVITRKIKFSSADFERGLWLSFKEGNPCQKISSAELLTLKVNGALKAGVKEIDSERINRVQILTIHGSKGLEAQNVFVHAAIPPVVKKSTLQREGIENEAYVWYVALTRTKQNLFIVSYPGHNYPIPGVCA